MVGVVHGGRKKMDTVIRALTARQRHALFNQKPSRASTPPLLLAQGHPLPSARSVLLDRTKNVSTIRLVASPVNGGRQKIHAGPAPPLLSPSTRVISAFPMKTCSANT